MIQDIKLMIIKSSAEDIYQGQKNGKVKEYIMNSRILLFEGNIKMEKEMEKVKNNNGKLKFNGEYFNDEIIEGKGYDINNNMILLIEKNGEGL